MTKEHPPHELNKIWFVGSLPQYNKGIFRKIHLHTQIRTSLSKFNLIKQFRTQRLSYFPISIPCPVYDSRKKHVQKETQIGTEMASKIVREREREKAKERKGERQHCQLKNRKLQSKSSKCHSLNVSFSHNNIHNMYVRCIAMYIFSVYFTYSFSVHLSIHLSIYISIFMCCICAFTFLIFFVFVFV